MVKYCHQGYGYIGNHSLLAAFVEAIDACWKISGPAEYQTTWFESITMEYVQNSIQPHIEYQEPGFKSDPMSEGHLVR